MRVLVNGCSFSRGPDSWPYLLPYNDIINLAQAGAGNTYIHESTISELAQRSYNLVLIMWTALERMDYKVFDPGLFEESRYTSIYQRTRNDWASKIVKPINDQDLVETDWIFGCGHINGEPALTKTDLFRGVYRYLDEDEFVYHFLMRMISLQSFLKEKNIPYVFSYYRDYVDRLKQQSTLYYLLDQSNIFTQSILGEIAESNHWLDIDGVHPSPQAHQHWAEDLHNFLNSTKRLH
jgi:hypothetical protein